MNEFWEVFWNSFREVCLLELRNVSETNLILFSLIVAGLVHIGCLIYTRVKNHPIYLSTEIIIILLICYANFIAQVTLMSRGVEAQARVFDTKWLWFDRSMNQNMTNLMNVILFIPYGALIAGLQKKKNKVKRMIMVMNYCFLTSLLIESMQYITNRGYFEIDDLETNILGGLTGGIFFRVCFEIGRLIHKKNTEVEDEEETQTRHV